MLNESAAETWVTFPVRESRPWLQLARLLLSIVSNGVTSRVGLILLCKLHYSLEVTQLRDQNSSDAINHAEGHRIYVGQPGQ